MTRPDGRRWRSDMQLRLGVRQLLRELQIEAPLNVPELVHRLADSRGRPIRLVPYPLPSPGAFGLWLATPDADYVLFQRHTSPEHQEHIILHELGHIIADHGSNEEDGDVWQQIFPGIPPEVVLRALRRQGYTAPAEQEAEMVATVIKEWASLLEHLGPRPRSGAFDDHQGWL